MKYVEVDPGPRLRPFVECLWALDAAAGAPVERVLPDGRLEIVLHLGASMTRISGADVDRQPRALIVGQQTGPIVLGATGAVSVVAARLRPHALRDVVGHPGRLLAGRIESLDAVIGRDADRWRERVSERRTTEGRLGELRRGLEARVSGPAPSDGGDPVARATAMIVGCGGDVGVERLAGAIGLGRRQLERLFLERVGLSPKRYARVVRFARVVAALERPSPSPLVAIAADCGYSDQAHLNRDFREFAGCGPSAYVSERNAWNALFASAALPEAAVG